ncbi:TetR/AcrR family transcriptional regulator [Gracilibacillus sp. YIM 98692]|uniref:TetR/AcrR family transcriptional regulator n=1 Tax=Gracilibacillus sp. YIM 98692 TaxID=2663532 RepID=UPI0013D16942|nr:TetR/AcrR family transcriptional regulator [Gracilibacillus sp. YIM 98692]
MSPRSGLNQQTVIKAAIEIANQENLQAVTIASLAKKLNVRSPSLYNHIDSLNSVFHHMAIYGLEELYDTMISSTQDQLGDEAIHSLSKAYIYFVRQHPGLYEATFIALKQGDSNIKYAADKIVRFVLKKLESYNFTYQEGIHIVRGLRSILHGFATIEQKEGFGIDIPTDESLTYILDTFLLGLKKG